VDLDSPSVTITRSIRSSTSSRRWANVAVPIGADGLAERVDPTGDGAQLQPLLGDGVQQPLLLALQLAKRLVDGRLPCLELLGQPCPTSRPLQGVGNPGRIAQQRRTGRPRPADPVPTSFPT
jgi:hypothetical protein